MDTIDLEFWMTNLPKQLRQTPLIHLAIPGSHDSMTSSITKSSKLAPDAEIILRRLNWMGPILRSFICRWCKTQDLDADRQLKHGIRYFDLRVATKPGCVYPYFVHGLYGDEVTSALSDIHNFVDAHPKEVIILDFQHFYAFTQESHRNLITLIDTIFKDQLVPSFRNMEDLTLDFMTVNNKFQVMVIYRSHYANDHPFLWKSFTFPTPWPETTRLSELLQKLNIGLERRIPTVAYVSQFLLTPTSWFVFKNIFSTLKQKCVIPFHQTKCEWIRSQNIGKHGVNVIISDFIDLENDEFVLEIIKLNFKFMGPDFSRLPVTGLTKVSE
ncbi:hypothetical protein FQR65_LT01726 [Abscondita terminalis]|nr:hypothetical protein FQR65_LT01726 [Abscondita terminalis]